MTAHQLEQALRAYARRRPLVPFLIEFNSGGSFLAAHPEAVRGEGGLFVGRSIEGRYEIFAADNVSRLVDTPPTAHAS
jgi:hypothetical protein